MIALPITLAYAVALVCFGNDQVVCLMNQRDVTRDSSLVCWSLSSVGIITIQHYICDATPRNQAECEKNIFEIFAVLESTHCPDHIGINFIKNGLILPKLQPIEKIKCICN